MVICGRMPSHFSEESCILQSYHAEAHCNLEPSQTSLHCFFCILDHEISGSTFMYLLYFALCSPIGHHTFARFHRLAPWKNVSIRIKLDSTAQQFTSSLQGASTNQQEGKDHANLIGHNRQLDIKCVHETVWRLSNLVKLLSFRVSSRVNVKIWMTDLQHWDEHPHSTLCMWKVPVCWHGCCLCARPGSRCGAIKQNKKREVMVGQDVNGTLLFTYSGIWALKLRQTQGLATSPSNPKDLAKWKTVCDLLALPLRDHGSGMARCLNVSQMDAWYYILSLKHFWRSLDNISWNQTASTFINLINQICSTHRAS